MKYEVRYPERLCTWREKLNPVWWFQTSDESGTPKGYAGTRKQWLARNLLHNFRRFVVGVSDKPRVVCGSMIETGNAFRQPSGVLWGFTFAPWLPPLPYLSLRVRYVDAVYDFALGWSAFGMLMIKLRKMRPGAFDWE